MILVRILVNQWRLLMSRNAISANSEHYIFKLFRGSMPSDPLEGLKNLFLAAAWLKIFSDRLPPKQKVLDRALPTIHLRTDDLT